MMTNMVGPLASGLLSVSFNDPHWNNVPLLAEYCAPLDEGPGGKLFHNFRVPEVITGAFGNGLFLSSTDSTTPSEMRNSIISGNSHTDYNMDANDFCCEIMLSRTSEPTVREHIFSKWFQLLNRRSYRAYYNPTNDSITFEASTNGSSTTHTARFILETDGVSLSNFFNGAYHHVAIVRNAGELAVYVDGFKGSITASISTTALYAPTDADDRFVIAALQTNISSSQYYQQNWVGNIDEVRVTKGVPRYTSAFTPVLPHPRGSLADANWSNVLCLIGFNEMIKMEAGYMEGTLTRFFGNGNTPNIALIGPDGIGLDVNAPNLSYTNGGNEFHLGSSDFTIEVFDLLGGNSDRNWCGLYAPVDGDRCWRVGMGSGAKPLFQYSTDGTTGTVVTLTATSGASLSGSILNFCIERHGTDLRMYRDGVMVRKDTGFTDTIFNPTNATPLAIGHQRGAAGAASGVSSSPFRGFRITKGVARYQNDAGYIVPTLPLPRS